MKKSKLTFSVIESNYLPLRNDDNSKQMKQYMKHQFEFLGIKKSETAPVYKSIIKSYELVQKEDIKSLVLELFASPYREYHYFAMMYLNKQAALFDYNDLSFLKSLIQTNSWWDSIDTISPNIVGQIVLNDRQVAEPIMMEWVLSDDIWLQRAGLLHQLKFKNKMNIELLTSMIFELKDEQAFFIRKAIGWVLREYSKTDAEFVIQFTKKYELSNLSKKEALKWLNSKQ